MSKSDGKTARSRRRVPLTTRALAALDGVPRRLDVRLVFVGFRGGNIDLKNFRRAQWKPTLESAGLPHARIYDLRHSFATWALDAGLSIFELARYLGTSVEMIDRVYGHLAHGAEDTARVRLDTATPGVRAKIGPQLRLDGTPDGAGSAWILKRAMGLEPTTLSLGS